ncbi:hypothetical protein AALO_G00177970 [Alosa alosa]|uniref:Uncharacterized protein n=1 Tax=Alosa alosa TaxID=278164 RepID=A0AAV6G853_9TELE|nr:hypothetical protein AALO_G00177970 [Alosa alosa]
MIDLQSLEGREERTKLKTTFLSLTEDPRGKVVKMLKEEHEMAHSDVNSARGTLTARGVCHCFLWPDGETFSCITWASTSLHTYTHTATCQSNYHCSAVIWAHRVPARFREHGQTRAAPFRLETSAPTEASGKITQQSGRDVTADQ